MSLYYGSIFVTDNPDAQAPVLEPAGKIWIKPSTGEVFVWNGTWTKVPITFNNIKLTGTITTDNIQGKSGTIIISGVKLKFHHGILVDSTPILTNIDPVVIDSEPV